MGGVRRRRCRECVKGHEAGRAEPLERPPSPCINVCSLDAQGLCVGCLRSGEEIARWMSMSAAEQWRLLAVLAQRRKLTR
jgi:predicted Fe-S protein YdhL (DUF1289 family)